MVASSKTQHRAVSVIFSNFCPKRHSQTYLNYRRGFTYPFICFSFGCFNLFNFPKDIEHKKWWNLYILPTIYPGAVCHLVHSTRPLVPIYSPWRVSISTKDVVTAAGKATQFNLVVFSTEGNLKKEIGDAHKGWWVITVKGYEKGKSAEFLQNAKQCCVRMYENAESEVWSTTFVLERPNLDLHLSTMRSGCLICCICHTCQYSNS